MQPTSSNSSGNSSSGGGGLSRASGLAPARFRSAPATWLEALLEEGEVEEEDEEEEEEEDPLESLRPNESLTQLLSTPISTTSSSTTTTRNLNGFGLTDPSLLESGNTSFLRQHSSPAEFLGSSTFDGLFSTSSFSVPTPGNYDYLSSNSPTGNNNNSNKRIRQTDLSSSHPGKFSTQVDLNATREKGYWISSVFSI